MRILSILATPLLLLACTPPEPPPLPPGAYFPAGLLSDFEVDWFGGQLAAAREPVLWSPEPSDPAEDHYRLLFVPSWTPTVVVRVGVSEDGSVSYHLTRLTGGGGDGERGQIAKSYERPVPDDLAENLLGQIGNLPVWEDSYPVSADSACFDGTYVVLEFRRGDTYRVVVRHYECDLRAGDPIRSLVTMFDEITGGKVGSDDFQPSPSTAGP